MKSDSSCLTTLVNSAGKLLLGDGVPVSSWAPNDHIICCTSCGSVCFNCVSPALVAPRLPVITPLRRFQALSHDDFRLIRWSYVLALWFCQQHWKTPTSPKIREVSRPAHLPTQDAHLSHPRFAQERNSCWHGVTKAARKIRFASIVFSSAQVRADVVDHVVSVIHDSVNARSRSVVAWWCP